MRATYVLSLASARYRERFRRSDRRRTFNPAPYPLLVKHLVVFVETVR